MLLFMTRKGKTWLHRDIILQNFLVTKSYDAPHARDSTNQNSQFVESMEAVQSRVFLSSHLFFLVYEYRH